MGKKLVKRYVVWTGRKPGVYSSWGACQKQVMGFHGARFKSFTSQADAEQAFKVGYVEGSSTKLLVQERMRQGIIKKDSICVDAACSSNPGLLERRGVRTSDGKELFRSSAYKMGTVNIGEYIALLRGIKYLLDEGKEKRHIYSDSRTAMTRVKNGAHNSQLQRTSENALLKKTLDAREKRYRDLKPTSYVLKRDTKNWGEIPADFGRK